MPRLVRPATPLAPNVEAGIDALSTPVGRAIIRHLVQHGPSSSHQLGDALGSGPANVRRTLKALEAAGLVRADVQEGDRNGRRVRYDAQPMQIDFMLNELRKYLRGR